MGAAGAGIFDDDSSFMALEEAIDVGYIGLVGMAIESSESDYIEVDDCGKILVAAAIADSVLNGTEHTDNPDFIQRVGSVSKDEIQPTLLLIREALNLVLSEKSELNELWEENKELYDQWSSNIKSIIARLILKDT